jgi:hypothetical protein
VASRQQQEQLLGVLHSEEHEAHVEQAFHVEVVAHVEHEASEEDNGGEDDSEEEKGAGQGEASSRSTTGYLNFNSIYIHFYMK